MPAKRKKTNLVRYFFSILGPGLVSGAADDDPSGIATYSIAGAKFGTSLLWTALLTWPLMASVQMMCARIGMVTGEGLAGTLGKKFPKWVLIIFSTALLIANSINIGADLSGMADAAEMLSGWNARFFIILFGVAIAVATIIFPYRRIAAVLKWLALALFAYILTALIVGPNWLEVLKDTFVPSWPQGAGMWATVVAILGTTISPYLFYWQSSQEVEEEKSIGRRTLSERVGATPREINNRRVDVGVGTFFSNLVMYFIILSTALTLHRHGLTQIETSRQAAEALMPLAGSSASILYTLGLLGVGFLAIPTLTGSAAYAFAEVFSWNEGLDEKFGSALPFYGIILLSTLVGMLLDFVHVNPVRALFLSAVVNGLLAPFLLLGVLLVASDKKIMQGQPSSGFGRVVVALTALAMIAAAVGMFVA